MRILTDNYGNSNLNTRGTLKICNSSRQGFLTDKSKKKIETLFAEKTKESTEKLDVLLFDRYSVENAQSDKVIFTDKDYSDSVSVNIKKCSDENSLLEKLLDAYSAFQQIRELREGIELIFK